MKKEYISPTVDLIDLTTEEIAFEYEQGTASNGYGW